MAIFPVRSSPWRPSWAFVRGVIIVGLLITIAAVSVWKAFSERSAQLETQRQIDALTLAEFRGRHSAETVSLDAATRVDRAYVFSYKVGDQEFRDSLIAGIWHTEVKVMPDAADPAKFQWLPVQVLQLLARQQASQGSSSP